MTDSTPSYFKSIPDEPPLGRHKTAIVTGASSGIGLELAKKLSLNGYRVVANSRRITSARTLAETEHIKLVDGDISLPETAERVVATAIQHFGTITEVAGSSPLVAAINQFKSGVYASLLFDCFPIMISLLLEHRWAGSVCSRVGFENQSRWLLPKLLKRSPTVQSRRHECPHSRPAGIWQSAR
jgi:hypothetical protein